MSKLGAVEHSYTLEGLIRGPEIEHRSSVLKLRSKTRPKGPGILEAQ